MTSQSRRSPVIDPVVDDYPIRPADIEKQNDMITRKIQKNEKRTLVLLSAIFFLYGSGISIYGPLYPGQARKTGLNTYTYGSVLATSHFICILTYPLAFRIVTSVSSRNSLSVGIFVVGVSRILFGTVFLIPDITNFILISFAVQAVEGFGMALLMTSTIVTVCGQVKTRVVKIFIVITASVCLGFGFGPIVGEVMKEELRFDIPFYIFGSLSALSFILIATMLPKPDQRISFMDVPIIGWMKDKPMIIYFFIIFVTFNYVGFLSISIDLLLKQFHLNSLYTGLMFSISPFVFGLTFPSWTWLIKKGCNNVMSIFIGSIAILASLIILGPAPYTSLEGSLSYVGWALALEGLGIACKSASVIDGSEEDLRHLKKYSEVQQQLIVYIVFIVGASTGYFTGSFATGFMDYYIGYKYATLPLFALEICIAVIAVIFALNRNYTSRRRRRNAEEQEPILRS